MVLNYRRKDNINIAKTNMISYNKTIDNKFKINIISFVIKGMILLRIIKEKTVYQLTFMPALFPVNCYLVE